jgi:hypothetical protein
MGPSRLSQGLLTLGTPCFKGIAQHKDLCEILFKNFHFSPSGYPMEFWGKKRKKKEKGQVFFLLFEMPASCT